MPDRQGVRGRKRRMQTLFEIVRGHGADLASTVTGARNQQHGCHGSSELGVWILMQVCSAVSLTQHCGQSCMVTHPRIISLHDTKWLLSG